MQPPATIIKRLVLELSLEEIQFEIHGLEDQLASGIHVFSPYDHVDADRLNQMSYNRHRSASDRLCYLKKALSVKQKMVAARADKTYKNLSDEQLYGLFRVD